MEAHSNLNAVLNGLQCSETTSEIPSLTKEHSDKLSKVGYMSRKSWTEWL